MADLFIIGQFEGREYYCCLDRQPGYAYDHCYDRRPCHGFYGYHCTGNRCQGQKSASRTIGNTVALFMAVAVGLMVILLLLVHPIVSVMSTPLEAVTGTVAYLTVCFIGIPCITAYNIISSIFVGSGIPKSDVFYCNCVCGEYRAGLSVYGIFTPWSGWGCAWYYFVAACECGHCTDRDHEKGNRDFFVAEGFSSGS